jgi:methionine salvage enolase-phosphatase E1
VHGPDSRSIVRDISGLQGYIKFLEDELFAVIDKDMLKYVRGELSATCVTNSDGVVTILEGRTAQNKRVTDDFTMVQKELEAL